MVMSDAVESEAPRCTQRYAPCEPLVDLPSVNVLAVAEPLVGRLKNTVCRQPCRVAAM